MERDPAAQPERSPVEPEDATPQEDAEELPQEPGGDPDTGHVVERKGREDGDEG